MTGNRCDYKQSFLFTHKEELSMDEKRVTAVRLTPVVLYKPFDYFGQ